MKILEQNENYEILQDVFNGQPITIRRWQSALSAERRFLVCMDAYLNG